VFSPSKPGLPNGPWRVFRSILLCWENTLQTQEKLLRQTKPRGTITLPHVMAKKIIPISYIICKNPTSCYEFSSKDNTVSNNSQRKIIHLDKKETMQMTIELHESVTIKKNIDAATKNYISQQNMFSLFLASKSASSLCQLG
jgi:hypothetical protein